MDKKKIAGIAAALFLGAVLNYIWAVVADTWGIPISIEFVIVAYCLLVILVPLRLPEVIGIGIISGLLTFLSNPLHAISISQGQVTLASGFSMAFFNLVSEPVGIVTCFFVFAFLAGTIRGGAPFPAALIATLASGLAYLVMVLLFNSGHIAAQPDYPALFLGKVVQVAVVNAILVQGVFLAIGRPVRNFLGTADR